jgi:hypothetical protein
MKQEKVDGIVIKARTNRKKIVRSKRITAKPRQEDCRGKRTCCEIDFDPNRFVRATVCIVARFYVIGSFNFLHDHY